MSFNFKEKRKLRKRAYDLLLADIVSKGKFLPVKTVTQTDTMTPNFAYVETFNYMVKYFMIVGYPPYIQANFLDELRVKCLDVGIKINYMQIGDPYTIDWSSAAMRNRISAWKKFTEDVDEGVSVWDYRESKKEHEQKVKLIESTLYLNQAEIDDQRTTAKVEIIIQLICDKDDIGRWQGNYAADELMRQAKILGIKLKPLKMNMTDWLRHISQFSRINTKELSDKIAQNLMTDDIVASMAGYKQGRIGNEGIPIGFDINRREAVLYMFKKNPNKVENWLISAMTGGGKSYLIKSILMWLLAADFTVTILDYEGDEYTELYNEMIAADPESAVLVSMGKGSAVYIEPMQIPDLVGDPDIDDDLKAQAQDYTVAMFRLMVHGTQGQLTRWEEGVVDRAIANVYAEHRVTNDKSTWYRSKKIVIKDVYDEIVRLVNTKEFFDDLTDNIQHKAAVEIAEACRPYFDEEGIRSESFKRPLAINGLRNAQLIIFSFGVKGAVASTTDQTILAMKQLSVANISTQISNYCKYVKHGFNVKVWEEYQRYGEVPGSAEIIGNSMTGGRKRGDINFIITNDLENILDDGNIINKQIRQSLSAYCIGKIKDTTVVSKFCEKFKIKEVEDELMKLAVSNGAGSDKRYENAFCLMLDDGKKALIRAELPKALAKNNLFSTGVKVNS